MSLTKRPTSSKSPFPHKTLNATLAADEKSPVTLSVQAEASSVAKITKLDSFEAPQLPEQQQPREQNLVVTKSFSCDDKLYVTNTEEGSFNVSDIFPSSGRHVDFDSFWTEDMALKRANPIICDSGDEDDCCFESSLSSKGRMMNNGEYSSPTTTLFMKDCLDSLQNIAVEFTR